MKTQLLIDIQSAIDMRSNEITKEQERLRGKVWKSYEDRWNDMKYYNLLVREQLLAKKVIARMIALENIVTYMEKNPK